MMGGILFFTAAWTCWPAGAAAQDASAVSARIVPGIVYQRAIFGDDAPRPATEIGVKDVAPREGPLTVETPDGITSLGREIARLVRVSPSEDE